MIINNISIPHNSCRQSTAVANYGEIPIMTIGRGSYIVNASIQCGLPVNLHIGQFCSFATNITFMLQIDKDYSRITTSSDELVALLPNAVLADPHIIKGQIIVQNDVWVGHNSMLMSGIKVGNGAIVAANSHVVKDVPPYAIVGGNPAKIIKYRFSDEQIADLQEIAWWDWSDSVLIERKPDFALPIQDFIDKYKVQRTKKIRADAEKKRILLFPDFDVAYSLWQRVIGEYCDRCRNGDKLGQLFIYFPEDSNADNRIKLIQDFLQENYDGSGDIYVQVGQICDENELFANSDYYVTTKESNTVRHSCMADKFEVKILSGADLPCVFSSILNQ